MNTLRSSQRLSEVRGPTSDVRRPISEIRDPRRIRGFSSEIVIRCFLSDVGRRTSVRYQLPDAPPPPELPPPPEKLSLDEDQLLPEDEELDIVKPPNEVLPDVFRSRAAFLYQSCPRTRSFAMGNSTR